MISGSLNQPNDQRQLRREGYTFYELGTPRRNNRTDSQPNFTTFIPSFHISSAPSIPNMPSSRYLTLPHCPTSSYAQVSDTGHLKSSHIDMPPQIPSHSLHFDSLRPRDLPPIQVDVSNPIHDSTFIATVAGIGSAGLVVLVIIGLILCLYRDKTICSLCCGKRKRKQKQEHKSGPKPNLPEPKVPNVPLAPVDTRSSSTSESTLVARPEPSHQFVDKLNWGV